MYVYVGMHIRTYVCIYACIYKCLISFIWHVIRFTTFRRSRHQLALNHTFKMPKNTRRCGSIRASRKNREGQNGVKGKVSIAQYLRIEYFGRRAGTEIYFDEIKTVK